MAAAPAITSTQTADRRPPLAPAPLPAARDTRATRGMLLAVCGTCPGAGASVLACLIALAAARERGRPVLVCDVGDLGAAVARPGRLTAAGSLLSPGRDPLLPTTSAVADDDSAAEPAARTCHGTSTPGAGLAGLIDRAHAANPLTIIDCGTLTRPDERHQIARADTVLWVLPASRDGLASARRAVHRLRRGRREILVARATPTRGGPRLRALFIAPPQPTDDVPPVAQIRRLAAQRGAPLILSPWLPPRAAAHWRTALETLQVPLQAILGALTR